MNETERMLLPVRELAKRCASPEEFAERLASGEAICKGQRVRDEHLTQLAGRVVGKGSHKVPKCERNPDGVWRFWKVRWFTSRKDKRDGTLFTDHAVHMHGLSCPEFSYWPLSGRPMPDDVKKAWGYGS